MGNTRGNTYSRNHVSFDPCPSCPDFWNFGFDDTGVKDYSAEIDHILEINPDYEKMHFVGHSMGCTQFVVSNYQLNHQSTKSLNQVFSWLVDIKNDNFLLSLFHYSSLTKILRNYK